MRKKKCTRCHQIKGVCVQAKICLQKSDAPMVLDYKWLCVDCLTIVSDHVYSECFEIVKKEMRIQGWTVTEPVPKTETPA